MSDHLGGLPAAARNVPRVVAPSSAAPSIRGPSARPPESGACAELGDVAHSGHGSGLRKGGQRTHKKTISAALYTLSPNGQGKVCSAHEFARTYTEMQRVRKSCVGTTTH